MLHTSLSWDFTVIGLLRRRIEVSDLNETLNKVINYGLPSPTRQAPPMSACKPLKKSAEEMLKRALEFANQGMEDYDDYMDYEDGYIQGKYHAYELMAAHLEMLIKEARQ
jgi:hypothetical protein